MIPFEGTVYRILPLGADPTLPVTSPEGRFHHSGQRAIYTSLTPEGTVVAIRRYMAPGDPPRVIIPLQVRLTAVVDLRGQGAASVVWQDTGGPSPTWGFSDAARAAGGQAMLYSSRSRPDLTHLVLFAEPGDIITATLPPLAPNPWLG